VRRYYAERIFSQSGRDRAPRNFRPLEGAHTGMSTVEGCRGGGKNILEVTLIGSEDGVADLRLSCGLCNPAMYVAADIVAEWARGRGFGDILAVDPLDVEQLAPFYEALGGEAKPDDVREKFQYALHAVQNAVRDHLGQPPRDLPTIPEATDRDLARAD
jgi:hypothetical protein